MPKKSYVTVTDQFCGAGGSSLGAASAGAEIKLAMNHWKLAIETHNTNFPNTDHDCTDVSACDPRRYSSTDILITSPECTNHSLAKGKQRKFQAQLEMFGRTQLDPAEERSRATMWDVPRFAEYHNYRLIIVENVVDARQWRLFDAWLQAMSLLDYNYEIVYLNSMFAHPTPQSRDRMYVVFWKKGNKAPDLRFMPPAYCPRCERDVAAVQCWKNPGKKWGRYGKNRQYLYHCPVCAGEVTPYYYCAANAIDWSLPSERIGDRKRPLKPKTLERIRVGLERYGKQGFVISTSHARNIGQQSPILNPLPTQTTAQDVGLVYPFMVPLDYTDKKPISITDPLPTQTARQSLAFVVSMRDAPNYPLKHITEPLPTQSTIGAPYLVELHGSSVAHPVTDPLGCILAGGGHHGLVMPFVTSVNYFDEITRPITEPMPTQTSVAKLGLTIPQPFIVSYYSGSDQAKPITDSIATVSTLARHALVQPTEPTVEDCYFRMLKSHEIGRAMAFPQTYVVLGNERERVKQFGNAVTPPAMEMILERCIQTLRSN